MSAPMDVAEAIAAARQAIQFDQDVDPAVVQVLLDVVMPAQKLVHHWRAVPAAHREYVYNADEETSDLIDELANWVGEGE